MKYDLEKGSNETSVPVEQTSTITGVISGHEWVDLGLSVKWATCNIGAEFPEEYGDYFAWGETKPKNTYTEKNCETYEINIGEIFGDPNFDAATANWGSSWRMPTETEMQELLDCCTWIWTSQNGVQGYKVASKKNSNYIFLPAVGDLYGSSLNFAGDSGYYWSSTGGDLIFFTETETACGLFFDSGDHFLDWGRRDYGRNVRPVTQ